MWSTMRAASGSATKGWSREMRSLMAGAFAWLGAGLSSRGHKAPPKMATKTNRATLDSPFAIGAVS